jgi:hypothetical protein
MQLSKLSPTKLLKFIGLANVYFHNNLENDRELKRTYYRTKDEIVKACITGVIKNVDFEYIGFEQDSISNTYAVIKLTSYIRGKESANLTVHFPMKFIPSGLRPLNSVEFTPYERNYAKADIGQSQFMTAYKYIESVGKALYKKKVYGYDMNEFIHILAQTIKTEKKPFKLTYFTDPELSNVNPKLLTLTLKKNYKIIIYKDPEHKCWFETTLHRYKKAAAEVMTFKLDKVMNYMISNSLMEVNL